MPNDDAMELTSAEQAILRNFDKLGARWVRFAHLQIGGRAAATRGLIDKGLLKPLADGEYWLTDLGVEALRPS